MAKATMEEEMSKLQLHRYYHHSVHAITNRTTKAEEVQAVVILFCFCKHFWCLERQGQI
mgnify:CR=1 FL=1